MAKTLIVASRVKELAMHETKQLNVAVELYPALTEKVEQIIKKAAKRAVLNGRTTLMAKDL